MSIRIDKSVFTAQERAQYEALIAKATVDPDAGEEEMEDEIPPFPPKKPTKKAEVEDMNKSASPEMSAALARLETLEKSIEMKEFSEIAKKYAPLGEKEDELAQTLYEMKKSNQANYDAYISVLDKSLGLVEKSGLFTEIGKSASGAVAGTAQSKVEAKAQEIMKSDSTIDYNTAIAKAWEDPSLLAEYDNEYFSK